MGMATDGKPAGRSRATRKPVRRKTETAALAAAVFVPYNNPCAQIILRAFLSGEDSAMHNAQARTVGEELKAVLERLRVLAKHERTVRGPDAEAIEIAIVNLDSAVEILTE